MSKMRLEDLMGQLLTIVGHPDKVVEISKKILAEGIHDWLEEEQSFFKHHGKRKFPPHPFALSHSLSLSLSLSHTSSLSLSSITVVPVLAICVLNAVDTWSPESLHTARSLLALIHEDDTSGEPLSCIEIGMIMVDRPSPERINSSIAAACRIELQALLTVWTGFAEVEETASWLLRPPSSGGRDVPNGWGLFQGLVRAMLVHILKVIHPSEGDYEVLLLSAVHTWCNQLNGIIAASRSTSTTDTPSPMLPGGRAMSNSAGTLNNSKVEKNAVDLVDIAEGELALDSDDLMENPLPDDHLQHTTGKEGKGGRGKDYKRKATEELVGSSVKKVKGGGKKKRRTSGRRKTLSRKRQSNIDDLEDENLRLAIERSTQSFKEGHDSSDSEDE